MVLNHLLGMQSISFATLFLLTLRTLHVLYHIRCDGRKDKRKVRTKPAKTLVVLGSGGHTTELLQLLSSLSNSNNYRPLSYIIASSDTTSTDRLEHASIPISHDKIIKIPRAREVGQSYFTSIFTTLYSLIYSAHIVLIQSRPDLLIINGPGTCLPIAFWTFIGRVLGICEGKIIFCESFCRVTSLSLTGRILRTSGIVDLFLVHWEELVSSYGKNCILIESFIRHSWCLPTLMKVFILVAYDWYMNL